MFQIKPGMLSQTEIVFLKVFNGTKAAYRREEYARTAKHNDIETYAEVENRLLEKGVLKRDKAGRVSSRLDYKQLSMFIALQTDTAEQLTADLKDAEHRLVEQNKTVMILRAQNLRWPESMQLDNEISVQRSISESIVNLRKRLEILNKVA